LETTYNTISVHGFDFDIKTKDEKDGVDTVFLSVNPAGHSKNDLSYFILGVPTDSKDSLKSTEVLSFEKKKDAGEFTKGSFYKVLRADKDDIPLIGLRIDEKIPKNSSSFYQYKLKLSNHLDFFAIGVKADENIYIMEVEKVMDREEMVEVTTENGPVITIEKEEIEEAIEKNEERGKPTKAICLPACEDFCLYFVIPECYSLCSLDDAKISVFKKCLFIEEEPQRKHVKVCTPCGDVFSKCTIHKAILNGSVKINASLKIKNDEACDEFAEICAEESFCIDEVIGYFSRPKKISLDKISICPDYDSLDVTVLNCCNGKTAIRLDGKLIISLKKRD